MCPVLMRVSVSKAKVENVVKPPHNPVLIKSTVFGASELFFTARAAISPIAKQPIRFITRVFTGKVNGSLRGIRPVRYLPGSRHYEYTKISGPEKHYGIQKVSSDILNSIFSSCKIEILSCIPLPNRTGGLDNN